jgi:8-amino-7-oxononanoate synthase
MFCSTSLISGQCIMLERLSAALSELRDADQFRDLATPPGIPLSSNDYLGLASHPRLREVIAQAAAEDDRVASTGSRLLSGNHARWEQLESQFAAFIGVEAALYFSSGYAANVGLLSSIAKPGDTIFSDSANHASLIDGIRLSRARKVIFPHADLNYLEDALRRQSDNGGKLVVVESIFSMEGDRAPIADVVGLCERFDAFLIVDEAHATGVEGSAGRGLTHQAGRSERVLATVHTCGKALASMGAFVAGSFTVRDFLINQARPFIFSTALPPYCAAHVSEASRLAAKADAERDHLQRLTSSLRVRLCEAGFDVRRSGSQIIPLILGPNETALRVAAALCAEGFAIRAVRPPTVPAGTARLRLSLNASLSMNDLDKLMHVLASCRGGL